MADTAGHEEAFERGQQVERTAEHGRRLDRINGSIADTARALADLASEVRQLREEARLRDERVVVAAETLAKETERRRAELATTVETGDRQWSRRDRAIAGAIAFAVLVLAILKATGVG